MKFLRYRQGEGKAGGRNECGQEGYGERKYSCSREGSNTGEESEGERLKGLEKKKPHLYPRFCGYHKFVLLRQGLTQGESERREG